jgi:D-glycero-D-manno-heptose 1,7-bisphosphate phosphatase
MKNPRLCIFDVDGTLTTTKSGDTFRKSADDWQWLPGRLEKLAELKAHGVRLAVATNQGGVAFGYMKQEDILAELTRTINEAGIAPGGLYVCYTHPKASIEAYRDEEDNRRKPGPGMLLDAMRDFGVEPDGTLYIGDRPEDEGAAKAANVVFMWSDDFFKKEA